LDNEVVDNTDAWCNHEDRQYRLVKIAAKEKQFLWGPDNFFYLWRVSRPALYQVTAFGAVAILQHESKIIIVLYVIYFGSYFNNSWSWSLQF